MILLEAVEALKKTSSGMGTEDGDLIFQKLNDPVCQFCKGDCMGAEFGGCVAEVASISTLHVKRTVSPRRSA